MSKPNAGLRPEVLPEADKVTSLVTTARRLLAEQTMVDLSALAGRSGHCATPSATFRRRTSGPPKRR